VQLLGQAAAGELQRSGDPCALGWTQPTGADLPFGTTEQRAQATGGAQQFAAQRQRVLAAAAAAQQHRQQLGVGERCTATRQHFFTGSFTFGPVTNAHARSMMRAAARAQEDTGVIPVS
jgi:hypothetical protein